MRAVRGPAMLLWVGLAVHRSPAVSAVLAGRRLVEVIRLPSYAPELNLLEPMWGHAKGVGSAATCRTMGSIWNWRPTGCSTTSAANNA